MSFIRTRTIKGRQYRYLEQRWREGRKVKSKSIFLGAIGGALGFIGANLRADGRALEKIIEAGEKDKGLALAQQALAIAAAEKTVPAGLAGTKDISEAIQPSSETAQHLPEPDGTAPAASPR